MSYLFFSDWPYLFQNFQNDYKKEKLIAKLETKKDDISMPESLSELGKMQFRWLCDRKSQQTYGLQHEEKMTPELGVSGKHKAGKAEREEVTFNFVCILSHLRKFIKNNHV